MARENELTGKSFNSNGGSGGSSNSINGASSSSKKSKKENKVPQRGPGIAMLEKIRIVEEQMIAAAGTGTGTGTAATSEPSNNNNNNLPLLLPKLHQPSFSQMSMLSPSTLRTTVPLPYNGGGGGGGPGSGNGFVGSLGYKSVPKNFGMEPGLGFLSNLLYQSNPAWTLPDFVKNKPSSPIVQTNLSLGTSSGTPVPPLGQTNARSYLPPSGPSATAVPPSNQPFTRNYVPSVSPLMTGIKRPNPYSLDVQLAPSSLNYNKLPRLVTSMPTNGTTSFGSAAASGSGLSLSLGYGNANFFNSSSSSSDPSSSKGKGIENGENFNGPFDFLKLAPPGSPTPSTHEEIEEDEVPSQKEYCFFPPAANAAQIDAGEVDDGDAAHGDDNADAAAADDDIDANADADSDIDADDEEDEVDLDLKI